MNSRNWICIVKYLDIEQWKNVEHKHEQLLPLSSSKLQQAGGCCCQPSLCGTARMVRKKVSWSALIVWGLNCTSFLPLPILPSHYCTIRKWKLIIVPFASWVKSWVFMTALCCLYFTVVFDCSVCGAVSSATSCVFCSEKSNLIRDYLGVLLSNTRIWLAGKEKRACSLLARTQ